MSIAENIEKIQCGVMKAALKVGRDPETIKIIAVTKYTGVEQINEAIRAGVKEIAENRVQDALVKFPLLNGSVTKHLIGTLQTNKVKPAVREFDLIHSVDRMELVEALEKEASKRNCQVKCLIQLNISGETTKHGIGPEDLKTILDKINSYTNITPMGLMTIAPFTDDPEQVRPIFRCLKNLFSEFALTRDDNWRYLSMGMSHDYQVAVEEGANMVRIGTAIFKD
ncbi:MAG TPA: YggS family pyridoxal phosphate-dependent enzyme [Firmicutes bacterium]|jgi:PLP dependent protein|nr:YggS family pyridoxal phosphate-dependent enzyme [Bacillota bacterium]